MRKIFLTYCAIFFAIALLPYALVHAQQKTQVPPTSTKLDPRTLRTYRADSSTPPPDWASADLRRSLTFLALHQADLGLLNPDQELTFLSVEEDQSGIAHLRLAQVHQGIPVFGATLFTHLDPSGQPPASASATSGEMSGLDGYFYPEAREVQTTPKLTAQQAIEAATAALGYRGRFARTPAAHLLILPRHYTADTLKLTAASATLVYMVELRVGENSGSSGHTPAAEWQYFVDAQSGQIISGSDAVSRTTAYRIRTFTELPARCTGSAPVEVAILKSGTGTQLYLCDQSQGRWSLAGSSASSSGTRTKYDTSTVVNTFNTRSGDVVLTSSDVVTALGFTPENQLTFTGPLVRSGNTIGITQSGGATDGYLSSSDWNTFNNKQAALGYTPEDAAKSHVNTFNGRSGAVSLTSGDVASALSYAPAGKTYIVVDAAGGGDYTTIQGALSAVPASGATILVKRGVYVGGLTISVPKVTIRGEGLKSTTIQSPLSSSPAITVMADDVSIEDLEIDGRRALQPGAGSAQACAGIYVLSSQRTSIRRVWVHSTLGNGISGVTGSNDGTVSDSIIENDATNINGTPGYHLVAIQLIGHNARWIIKNNLIQGWSQGVGLWYGATDCLVEGNRLINNFGFADSAHNTKRSAIEDYGADTIPHGRNRIVNNVIDGTTSYCLEIAQGVVGSIYSHNILLRPGRISNSSGMFAVVGANGQPTSDILIEGNYMFSDGTKTDTALFGGQYANRITIANNIFSGFSYTGGSGPLYAYGGSGLVIRGNQIYNSIYGVYVSGASDGVNISGNFFSAPIPRGSGVIYIATGNKHLIENNVIEDTAGASGIFVYGGRGHRIIGNRYNGTWVGINLPASETLISGNTITTTTTFAGILVTGNRNTVEDNHVDAPGRSITLAGAGDYNIVQENTILQGTVNLAGSGTHNTIEPNTDSAVARAVTLKVLGAVTVGTTQVAIPHGLGYAPSSVTITMTSPGTIYKSATSDATNIYLTADAAGRTAEIYVR